MKKTKLDSVDVIQLEKIDRILFMGLSIKVLRLLKQRVDRLIKHKDNITAKTKMKGVLYASFVDPKTNRRKFGKLPQLKYDRKLCGETICLYNSNAKGHTLRYFVEWADLTPCNEKGKSLDK